MGKSLEPDSMEKRTPDSDSYDEDTDYKEQKVPERKSNYDTVQRTSNYDTDDSESEEEQKSGTHQVDEEEQKDSGKITHPTVQADGIIGLEQRMATLNTLEVDDPELEYLMGLDSASLIEEAEALLEMDIKQLKKDADKKLKIIEASQKREGRVLEEIKESMSEANSRTANTLPERKMLDWNQFQQVNGGLGMTMRQMQTAWNKYKVDNGGERTKRKK